MDENRIQPASGTNLTGERDVPKSYATLEAPESAKLHSRPARALALLGEYSTPLLLSGALILACLIASRTTPFWTDEILTYYPVTDPSFSHLLAASRDIINTTPPLFFIFAWGWAKIFGGSELALRILSPLGFSGAFWIMWFVLRRRFNWTAVSLGLVAPFLAHPLLSQNEQARFYGAYMLACAFAIFRYAQAMETKAELGWKEMALNSLAHSAMVFTHTFGFLYSGCLGLAALLFWSQQRAKQVRFCVSIVAAWAFFFLVWGSAFLHHMGAFEQSWIPVPSVKRLFHTLMWGRSVLVLGVLSLATFLLLRAWARVDRLKRLGLVVEPSKSGARQLLWLGILLLLLPFTLAWVVSQLGTSCFLERYLLPSGLGWAIILSYLIHHSQLYFDAWGKARSALPMRFSRGKALALIGLAVLFCLAVALPSKRVAQVMSQIKTLKADDPEMRRPDLAIDRLARTNGIPDDVPIVCTFIHRYNPVFFYSKKPSRYFFILDQDYIKTKEGRVGTTDYLLMSALERNYPEQNVLSWNEFASTRQRFAVLDEQQSPWTQYRLGSKSEFDISEVFSEEAANMRLLLATRKTMNSNAGLHGAVDLTK